MLRDDGGCMCIVQQHPFDTATLVHVVSEHLVTPPGVQLEWELT